MQNTRGPGSADYNFHAAKIEKSSGKLRFRPNEISPLNYVNEHLYQQKSSYLYLMKVDKALIDKLASLSKLEFSEAECTAIEHNLSNMLDFIDKLNEVDVTGVEPLVYINPATNIMRQDEAHMDITKEDALKNAPLADSDYFKVPKVIRK